MFCLLFVLLSCSQEEEKITKKPISSTEKFVIEELMTEDNLLRTDLTQQKDVFLSESVGLWLTYLLEKDDQARFDEQLEVINNYFLEKKFIVWRIDGKKQATVNALIDDFRIMRALFDAGEKWHDERYITLGKSIGKNIVKYGMQEDTFVDFVDVHTHNKANTITLSYIMPSALLKMRQYHVLSKAQLEHQLSILSKAPKAQAGFFPKYYDVVSKNYEYDTELHMIDQLYTAYHSATLGLETKHFTTWLLSLYSRDHKLYGRYDASTGEPAVTFESPAVYAMATRYMLEIHNDRMAEEFFRKMESLKANANTGYVDVQTNATHIFDNLLPLLAEREVDDANSNKME
jgi:predicted nucleic-acid-binding protein